MTVAIVDYGSGNLRSAAKALERAAAGSKTPCDVVVTDRAAALDRASHIVLPGVGAFGDCARGLGSLAGMREALERNVRERGKPFLGICVGMQLLAERGIEHGTHQGLGWIEGEVRPFATGSGGGLRIPHMGWNTLSLRQPDHPAFAGIDEGAHVYFVHSNALFCRNEADIAATVEYGISLVAVVARDNMLGTQFHPEKSQATGLRFLANFLDWRP